MEPLWQTSTALAVLASCADPASTVHFSIWCPDMQALMSTIHGFHPTTCRMSSKNFRKLLLQSTKWKDASRKWNKNWRITQSGVEILHQREDVERERGVERPSIELPNLFLYWPKSCPCVEKINEKSKFVIAHQKLTQVQDWRAVEVEQRTPRIKSALLAPVYLSESALQNADSDRAWILRCLMQIRTSILH